MKVLTDPQMSEINHLLIEIEKNSSLQTVAYAEKIRAIILQAEPVTVHLEC